MASSSSGRRRDDVGMNAAPRPGYPIGPAPCRSSARFHAIRTRSQASVGVSYIISTVDADSVFMSADLRTTFRRSPPPLHSSRKTAPSTDSVLVSEHSARSKLDHLSHDHRQSRISAFVALWLRILRETRITCLDAAAVGFFGCARHSRRKSRSSKASGGVPVAADRSCRSTVDSESIRCSGNVRAIPSLQCRRRLFGDNPDARDNILPDVGL